MNKQEFYFEWLKQHGKEPRRTINYIHVGSYKFSPRREHILLGDTRIATGFGNLCKLLNIESPNLYEEQSEIEKDKRFISKLHKV